MLSLSQALAIITLLVLGLPARASPLATPPAPAWSGVVSYVVDGDTVRVRPPSGGKPISVRINGIDAPEICQAGGSASRDALMRKLLGQRVAVYGRHHDDYGRLLVKITLKGEDTGEWMVAQGLAWSYRSRASAGPYAEQQRRARAAGLGIFSPSHAVPPVYPAQFRKQHGSCR
ncbi:thermonuclease family protein [Polaromonas aquatica]|uniref:thermonuclease family protein n=1 Tax=Polaromonas aquatica TaxID=332657 RepID=UPI003D64651A